MPITNEADGKQGVIVFAGDRVGSAMLGNTYLARSPGSEVEGGQPIVKSLAKMQSDVALLSPAAAENRGGVRLQESSIRKMRTCLGGMAKTLLPRLRCCHIPRSARGCTAKDVSFVLV